MKFASLIWSNLKRKKLRTILTLLSIFVAFLLFGFLLAIKEAFTGGVSMAGADRLIVRHRVSIIQTLPQSYEPRIMNIPGVDAVAGQTWFGGIYKNEPKNFFATMPVDPEKFLNLYPEYILPAEQKAEWLKTRTGAILGRTTANRFNVKVGDTLSLTSPIWGQPANAEAWEFQIVGIYDGAKKNTDLTSFFFRYDYFDEARQRGKGEIGWYTVRVKDPDQAVSISKKIDEDFANSAHETKAETEAAMAQGFAQQMGDIGTIMIAVLSAVFFTILLVAGNTMGQAVRERTEELGVLKAIGFTNGLVLVLVLAESILIAVIGGGLGVGAAWAIVTAGNPVPEILPNFFLPDGAVAVGLGLSVILGIIAGAFPAIQAMRLQIAVALRRNG